MYLTVHSCRNINRSILLLGRYDMNRWSQMQGWSILDFAERDQCKLDLLRLSLAGNLGKSTYVPQWDRMEGAWLWTPGDGQAHVGTRAGAQLPLMHCVGWEQAAPRPPRHSAATSRPPPPTATTSHVSNTKEQRRQKYVLLTIHSTD